MNWSINGRIVKSLMKDGKEIVKVERTEDGKILYEKKENDYCTATIIGSSITLGYANMWLYTVGDVIINWGDGTTTTVNNPSTPLTHNYTDGKQKHNIAFVGEVTNLGEYCFKDTGLTSITIPPSVTGLKTYCFGNCTGLTLITIPPSVTKLGTSCFDGCTGLTSITIPSSITSLTSYCFRNCTGLTSVVIPDSITSLGTRCFYGCTQLTNYQLYWTGNNIITYDSNKMPNKSHTVFTIPSGETANYISKKYPPSKLVERSS